MSDRVIDAGQVGSPLIAEVSALVTRITGVQLGERQKTMVETRLKRRFSELGIHDETEYLRYLRANLTQETEELVSLLTTHHTFFFREFQHFQHLIGGPLQSIAKAVRTRGESKLRVWSAACSRGQEVYTLAMFLHRQLPLIDPTMRFEILGTDVDRDSVATAQNGVYNSRELKQVPLHYLADHWAKGTGDIAEFVKAKASLKTNCQFKHGNLLDLTGLTAHGKFDLIFCRNVFIYFTPQQIEKIARALTLSLQPSGLFIIGTSESLNGMKLPLDSAGPSIYTHEVAKTAVKVATSQPLQVVPSRVLKVLCVDDSRSVLAVLGKVLEEKSGFRVVGTAENGIEAAKKIAELKPDVVTLDIHMPEMTGLEYLRTHWSKSHPPVVMVSSVARADATLAMQCLTAGAADYVEKPTLANLIDRGDELRMKLITAFDRGASAVDQATLESQFGKRTTVTIPPTSTRVVIAGLGNLVALSRLIKELKYNKAPIVIMTEGVGEAIEAMATSLSSSIGQTVRVLSADGRELTAPSSDGIFIGDLKTHWDVLKRGRSADRISVMVFGVSTTAVRTTLGGWKGVHVLLEDVQRTWRASREDWVADVCPATSFAYMSDLFLSGTKRAA